MNKEAIKQAVLGMCEGYNTEYGLPEATHNGIILLIEELLGEKTGSLVSKVIDATDGYFYTDETGIESIQSVIKAA